MNRKKNKIWQPKEPADFICWPIRRKIMELNGCFISEDWKSGKIAAFGSSGFEKICIVYPDGTHEWVLLECTDFVP